MSRSPLGLDPRGRGHGTKGALATSGSPSSLSGSRPGTPGSRGERRPQSSQKLWICLRLSLALNRSFNFWPLLLARFLGKMPCLLPSTFPSQCCEDRNQLPGSTPSPKDTCDQGRSWPGLGTLHLIRCPAPHLPATGLQWERLPPSPDKHLSFMPPQALIPPQDVASATPWQARPGEQDKSS